MLVIKNRFSVVLLGDSLEAFLALHRQTNWWTNRRTDICTSGKQVKGNVSCRHKCTCTLIRIDLNPSNEYVNKMKNQFYWRWHYGMRVYCLCPCRCVLCRKSWWKHWSLGSLGQVADLSAMMQLSMTHTLFLSGLMSHQRCKMLVLLQ